jgi:integrase
VAETQAPPTSYVSRLSSAPSDAPTIQKMYTDPVIVHEDRLDYRSYITFVVHGERYRYYNGKVLDVKLFPNKAKQLIEKRRILNSLSFAFRKMLEKGWTPMDVKTTNPYATITVHDSIKIITSSLPKEDISERYREDLERVARELQEYLKLTKTNRVPCKNISATDLERFLEKFKTSSAYYMTKRSSLAGLFTRMKRCGMIETNPVLKTSRKKTVVVLNEAFTKDELRRILNYLKENHVHLYLCALLMYGCFLRPHREVRSLKNRHLSEDYSMITLAGNENKGKGIRIIRVPLYVKAALVLRSTQPCSRDSFVVTGKQDPFNRDYFKTAWGRLKKDMQEKGLIRENHTLYSFRHTGAVELYRKTKDPYKVQQAMGHSTLTVTLTYLRSLGISITISEDLPELPE